MTVIAATGEGAAERVDADLLQLATGRRSAATRRYAAVGGDAATIAAHLLELADRGVDQRRDRGDARRAGRRRADRLPRSRGRVRCSRLVRLGGSGSVIGADRADGARRLRARSTSDVGERQLRHQEQQNGGDQGADAADRPDRDVRRRARRRSSLAVEVSPTCRITPNTAEANAPPIVLVVLVRPVAMPGLADRCGGRGGRRERRDQSARSDAGDHHVDAPPARPGRASGMNSR